MERTHTWGNNFGRCAEGDALVVEFWLALAHAIIALGRLLRRAWTHYRWEGRSCRP